MKMLTALATIATLAFTAAPAAAQSLIGDTVTVDIAEAGSSFGSQTVVVGAGPEGDYFGNQIFDFGANSFSIRSTNPFCGFTCGSNLITFTLGSLDLGMPITGITVSTLLSGVTTTFTANSATFTFTDQTLPATTYLTATFETAGVVPEPATWAMMIGGLGVAGGAMRRRTMKVAVRHA